MEWEYWCMYIPHLFYSLFFLKLSPSVSSASDLHVQWIIWAERKKKRIFSQQKSIGWLTKLLYLFLMLWYSPLSLCFYGYLSLLFLVKINTIIQYQQQCSEHHYHHQSVSVQLGLLLSLLPQYLLLLLSIGTF